MVTAKRFAKLSLIPVDYDVRSSLPEYFKFLFSLLATTRKPRWCAPVNCVFPAHRLDLRVFTAMEAVAEVSN